MPIPLNNPEQQRNLFDRMGGEPVLRAVIDDFVERVVRDGMIGFFFRDFDPVRLKRLEYQFAARALGADVAYEGRPIQAAHARHPIQGGHFARRAWLLRQACDDHGVPPDIRDALLAHVEALRPQVTQQPGSTCAPDVMPGPLVSRVEAGGRKPEK